MHKARINHLFAGPLLVLMSMLAILILAPVSARADLTLTTELISDAFSQPIFLCSPPGDLNRLFVLEQKSGLVRIIKNGSLLSTPFLNVSSLLEADGSEEGLLGMAFHPDYALNGYFYIYYTGTNGNIFVARYQVSTGNPDIANSGSAQIVITIPHPGAANHNGGMIAFGPYDGFLYIGTGDGGGSGDTNNDAQNGETLLGKILRLDVDGGNPYAIPPDNPFIGLTDTLPEIWAFGLRNPWRYGFDRATGDLYIGDVGQGVWEEIDFQPASSPGGENYGWRCYEGNHSYNTSGCAPAANYIFPIHEYSHSSGNCSISGGYVYRGCAVPDLDGTYFYADFCTGRVWSFRYDGQGITGFLDRSAELDPPGAPTIDNVSSFGEDARGEIYIVDYDGEIYKIVRADGGSSCTTTCGDPNEDGRVDILDILFLINHKFKGGPGPNNPAVADLNGSGDINILDIIILINFKFKGGPEPDCQLKAMALQR